MRRWACRRWPRRQIYPLTARIEVNDNYFGTKVADPYRWLENLDSPAVQQWVSAAERAVAAAAGGAAAARLAEEAPHAAVELRALRRARQAAAAIISTCTTTASRTRACCTSPSARTLPGRVLFDPNGVRERCHRGACRVRASEHAARRGLRGLRRRHRLGDLALPPRGGWHGPARHAALHQVLGRLLGARRLGCLLQPLSGGRADGKGDDAARPAVYFHKLGTAQDAGPSRLRGHGPSRRACPRRGSPRTVITSSSRWCDGYEKNGVELLDLRKPGAKRAAAVRCTGTRSTTSSARMAMSSISRPPTTRRAGGSSPSMRAEPAHDWRTVVPEAARRIEQASYVGGRIVASYVEDAHGVARVYERDGTPRGRGAAAGPGTASMASRARATQTETFFSYTDYLTPRAGLSARRGRRTAPRLWREPQVAGGSPTPYVTEQVFYTSKDGTRVPMFITHRRDMAEGRQPARCCCTATAGSTSR